MNKVRYILESELGVEPEEKPAEIMVKAEESGVPIPPHLSKAKGLIYNRKLGVFLVEVK